MIDFIKTFIKEIMMIVIIVLFLLVLMNIKGINLNAPKPVSKIVQQVTVETFANDLDDQVNQLIKSPADNFCESYLGNSLHLENDCNNLTESNCANAKCCIYNNSNKKCVSGDINGPTYKTDKDGKLITMDTYYYLGKCRGICPT